MNGYHRDTVRFSSVAILAVAALLLLLAPAVLAPERVADAPASARNTLLVLFAAAALISISGRLPETRRVLLRSIGVIALTSFLFSATAAVQHVFFDGWHDAELILMETTVTGVELSLWLEGFTHPVLTEWLMASYVIYVPLIPLTAWVCYRGGGEPALNTYLFSLLAVNVLCDLGFVLYPVASQLFFDPGQYTVALSGGPFTAAAEWMRANAHVPGCSFPSPHCGVGTVMFVFLLRYSRRWGLAAVPFLISIPFATVYGRFHYATDGIVAIVMAGVVLHAVLRRGVAETRPSALDTCSRIPVTETDSWRMS